MRGFIHGSFWGLIVGGAAVGTVSVWDDVYRVTGPVDTAPVPLSADAPSVQQFVADALPDPMLGTTPNAPLSSTAPLIYAWVPQLGNTATEPMLPLVHGESRPAEDIAAATEVEEEPVVEEVAADEAQADEVGDTETPQTPDEALPDTDAPDTVAEGSADDEPTAEVETTAETSDAPTETEETSVEIAAAEEGSDEAQPSVAAVPTGPRIRINRTLTQPQPAPVETVEEPAEVAVEDPAAEGEAEEPTIDPDAPALARLAAPFENPGNAPVIGVVLQDASGAGDPALIVSDLGFAPTIVIASNAPNAVERAEAYVTAGAEVAVALALPEGAQPTDVEVVFGASRELMSFATMIVSPLGDEVQADRYVTTQVLAILGDEGLGFVVQERGLGRSMRTAEQMDVPAASIGRVLESDGLNTAGIARALDQSAFRVRQSGDTVVLGTLDNPTIAALGNWSRQNIGAGVVLGPASAVLMRSAAPEVEEPMDDAEDAAESE